MAQQINTTKLDSLFNILSSKDLMMGSVAISKDNKIVYKKSFGYRYIDSSRRIPADENTKYRIGSITKLFTSVMIFQLVQEHKLSLDTKLVTFFPQIKNANKITISDMLHHRSGIHDASNDKRYLPEMQQARSASDIIKILAECPSDFEPDIKSAYSNANFTLLGYIVERLDKDNYEKSLEDRIINKLHLKNTFVGGDIKSANEESFPYTFEGDKWMPLSNELIKIIGRNTMVVGGAGSLVSTPTDLNIFMNALFGNKLMSKESFLQDTTIKGRFGMDIYKIPFDEKYCWGHNGSIGGLYYSDLYKIADDKDDLTIAVCYNGVNYNTNDILIAILSCCFDRPFSFSQFNKPVTLNIEKSILEKYAGTYSSKDNPLQIKIFIERNQLFAQAMGQSAIPLNAVSEKEFVFKQAGIIMMFNADKNEFTLKQGGGNYLFQKEK